MLVGLPGSGKTTWAQQRCKQMPNKHYNIIGTDTLIERMKVDGLARKLNYNGSWETLINMASAALNKLFMLGMYSPTYSPPTQSLYTILSFKCIN